MMLRALLWACVAQASSEDVLGVQDGFNQTETVYDDPQASFHNILEPRLETQIRELPVEGASIDIGPGDIHTWTMASGIDPESRLTISECYRQPSVKSNFLSISIGDNIQWNTSDGGFLLIDKVSDLNDSSISIHAPLTGEQWTYQIGAGSASSYSFAESSLYLVDTDFANALLVTDSFANFSSDLQDTLYDNTPYGNVSTLNVDMLQLMIDSEDTASSDYLFNSYCASRRVALMNEQAMDVSNTTRGDKNGLLRGQFLIPGLNMSSTYMAHLALPPIGGNVYGGARFPPVILETKSSTTCQLVYNMTFCSEMAFTVPGNASAYTIAELTDFYDQMAASRYDNFTHALNQINCNVSRDLRYSVVSTCDDCAYAYKQWLCAVTVPRCADWDNPASYLVERNVGQSRNPEINVSIQPGRYKEVLPCRSLVHDLVMRCPAALQFQAPNRHMISQSYGEHSDDGDVTCSYPGAVYDPDGAAALSISRATVLCAGFSLLALLFI